MSHASCLRYALLSAAVCGPLLFALPARGDHPPLGGIEEPPVQATAPIFETVIDEGSFRLKRFPVPDTTLINDVQITGKLRTTADQTLGQCKASPDCADACKTPSTGHAGAHPAGNTWRPVTFPQSVKSGPCGTESCFAGDAIFGPAPQSTVYGDVLRLFDTPAIQQVAVTCANPQCAVASRVAAAQVCPLCCETCACAGSEKNAPTSQQSATVAALVEAQPASDLQRGEAAEVILNLIDDVGPSVLKGTLFEELAGGCLDEHGCRAAANREAARELVIQWVRQLENDEKSQTIKQPESHGKPEAKYVKIKHVDPHAESVDVLREVARTLDDAAELLEEQSLYPRADQLREIAQQIRHDARGQAGPIAQRPALPTFSHPRMPPTVGPATQGPTPPANFPLPNSAVPRSGVRLPNQAVREVRDLELELDHIRRQLEQLRDAL